jgi:peptide/nickel transport system ATP-binding protein
VTNFRKILEVNELTVDFRSDKQVVTAVDGLSFSMNESETLAIVGESGSGKSVTALSVLRLIPSPPGRIRTGSLVFTSPDGNQTDLLHAGEEQMQEIRGKEISMIFQEPMTSLNPVYTCGNQVSEVIIRHLNKSRKEAREMVLELFNEVRLPRPAGLYSSYPHQLSGGQKQRVMIAMAIACNPQILIADEPTTALDVTVQKTILELLKNLQESRKMSILFITHDLGLVADFAHRVLVMYKGKKVEEGLVASVFRSPEHPYTQGLMACRPPLDRRLEQLPTIEKFMAGERSEQWVTISPEKRELAHRELYSATPVLEVTNLSRRFTTSGGLFGRGRSEVNALQAATFSVYGGETLGIVGESGSGKTTLARVVLELIPPSAGTILYQQTDITQLSAAKMKKLRKDLQIIFQDPYSSLNPRLTIGSAIMEPMQVHRLHGNDGVRRSKTLELLEKVGLKAEHADRYPHEFSGGQRQRICIARALAVEPKLIICDESVSALDVSIQAQVLNLLNDLKKAFGLTYLFISHDLSVVKYMSDRLIVMKDGAIQEMGEADRIYADPQSPYTRMLLEAIPKKLIYG